jgi:hypothetical protein
MERICVNPKNYKLTQNKTYDIISEEEGYIFLTNDSNKVVRYDASLFQDEVIVPLPPIRTEQDCINSINSTSMTRVYFEDLQGNEVILESPLEITSNQELSCGITMIVNINSAINVIENAVDTTEQDLIVLKRKLLIALLKAKYGNLTTGLWMCSTNNNQDNEDYYTELNEYMTTNSGWFRNPNSGNQICLWTKIINQD